MPEDQDAQKKEDKACCSGVKHCCGSKALLVLVLVLLAGVIGYLIGARGFCSRNGWHHRCGYGTSMMETSPASQAPASK